MLSNYRSSEGFGAARVLACAEGVAVIQTKPPKLKVCKVCECNFLAPPGLLRAKVCGPVCAGKIGRAQRIKAEKARLVREKRETREKLSILKPRGYWLARAKKAIQQFRRLEELAKGRGCMSCGRSQEEVTGTDSWKPGGLWDGGHFLSKGARPELALEPLNIWLQCKSCNGGSGKYARKGYTVNQSFEANLIAQEGAELVEWLKGPHEAKHYETDEIKSIEATYTAKTKELKARQAHA
ncbi:MULTISPECIES: recombination protein NinG [unclassified Polaromonas]|uniref:recombination protein NinG n=1 Tax=unclassified Polaromonas TaxID=2638319 RepID=UPI00260101D0|nr:MULTISPECIES: recombination protein NinG [unclassified Polaromonas]HQR98143.1 recombination protein NinG [Polaromonas sp.]HQS38850.1 recombination protein NinG [Polaromonas sp.]HQS88103.1 recombination protein NinG [Polaromonas sp.]